MLVTMGYTTTATLLLVWAAVITFTRGAYVNVALDGSPHNSQGLASSIADGDVNYCRQTGNWTNHPWLEVDLERVYPVYNIDVWSHDVYQTHMYPSTITVDGETCTTITEPWLGDQKTVWCPEVMYGQRVRITRDGMDQPLTLCEIQIWVPVEVSQCPVGKHGAPCDLDCSVHCGQGPGKNFCDQETAGCYDGCVDGWYGDQCSTACSQGCQNDDCDSDTGQCAPCNTGYTGDSCTECEDKHFKTSAGMCEPCNPNCRSERCLFISGTCAGCVDGYHGDQCDRLCPPSHCRRCLQFSGFCYECALNSNLLTPECTDCVPGYYKSQGDQLCTRCTWICKSGAVCDQATGHCPVCPPGKQGDRCDQDCDPDWYGQDCAEQCGHCDNNEPCDPETGECIGGCNDGWKDTDSCKEECDVGTWGSACTGTCGQCSGGVLCDKVNGHCPLCEPGWYPPSCDISCLDGHYGNHCSMHCGSCLNDFICNKAIGHCPVCAIGKQPPLCATDCQNHRYGQNCSETCGQCRGDQPCDPVTGHCSEGCAPGWTDPVSSAVHICKTKCPEGTYGEECNQTCGHCRVTSECRHDTGHCTGPCADGYTGQFCVEAECPEGTYGEECKQTCGHCRVISECRHDTGHCTGPCADGYTGQFCAEAEKQEAISSILEDNDFKVIAVSVGAGVVVLVLIVIIVCIVMKRRSRRRRQQTAIPRQTTDEHTADTSIDPQDNRLETDSGHYSFSRLGGFVNAAQVPDYDLIPPVPCRQPAHDDPSYLTVELT